MEKSAPHRPFRVHHLHVCSVSRCLIAASSDGRIALLPLSSANREARKTKEDSSLRVNRAVVYLQVDGTILSVDSMPLHDHPQLFRAVAAYRSPRQEWQLSGDGPTRLLMVEWDCSAAQPIRLEVDVRCSPQERLSFVRSLPRTGTRPQWADAALIVVTSERVLLLSSSWRDVASTPLPDNLRLSCVTCWGSQLLCAFSGGELYRLLLTHEQTEATSWQHVGLVVPCLQLLTMDVAEPGQEPLLLVVGDGGDSGVWSLGMHADGGSLQCLQRTDSRAPLVDVDVCEHQRGDRTQLQLFTVSGLGQHCRSAAHAKSLRYHLRSTLLTHSPHPSLLCTRSLRVLTEGVGVEWQSASSQDFELLRDIWPLRHPVSSPHHLILVCSFHSSTRVLSCQDDLIDVTDLTHVVSDQRTVAAAFTPDGSALIQVTPTGLRVLRVNSAGQGVEGVFQGSSVAVEWRVRELGPGDWRVTHAAMEGRWVVLGVLQPARLVLCHVSTSTAGQWKVAVVASRQLMADISCLSLLPLEGGDASGAETLLCAVGSHSSSLDLYSVALSPSSSSFTEVASTPLAAFRETPCTPALAEVAIAESCVFVPPSVHSPCPSLLVGLREGLLLHFVLNLSSTLPSLSVQQPIVRRLGHLPVRLCSADTADSPAAVLAVSGHLSLLQSSPLSAPFLTCSPVADVSEYAYAVHFSTAGFPSGSILAVRDARLHVLVLRPPPPSPLRCLLSISPPSFHSAAILFPQSPYRVLYHPSSHCVLAAVESGSELSHLLLVDVAPRRSERGEELGLITGRYGPLLEGERVLAMNPATLQTQADFINVGTSIAAVGRGVSRGRLLLFRITRCSGSASEASVDGPPSYELRLVAAVRTRAPVVSLTLEPRGVVCACGSWLVMYGLQGGVGDGEQLAWRKLGSREMRNRIRSVDAGTPPLLFAAVDRDGVNAVAMEEEGGGQYGPMRWTLMDPEPRMAQHVLALPSAQADTGAVRVMRADDEGRVQILRGKVASAGDVAPAPAPLFEAEAHCDFGREVVVRCRLLRSSLPSPLAEVERVMERGREGGRGVLRKRTPRSAALVATREGRLHCIEPVEGSPADIGLLQALHRYLRSRVETCVSAGRVEAMKADGEEILDGDLLLSVWQCSVEKRRDLLKEWTGAGESELRAAVYRWLEGGVP